jgi:hypothetical protein
MRMWQKQNMTLENMEFRGETTRNDEQACTSMLLSGRQVSWPPHVYLCRKILISISSLGLHGSFVDLSGLFSYRHLFRWNFHQRIRIYSNWMARYTWYGAL